MVIETRQQMKAGVMDTMAMPGPTAKGSNSLWLEKAIAFNKLAREGAEHDAQVIAFAELAANVPYTLKVIR